LKLVAGKTAGVGNIVASGITLGPSQLNWNGSSVGGTSIYPANLVQQVACGDGGTFGAVTDAGPCDVFAMARNYKTPWVTTWTLGVQRAFSSKLSLDVAYVGNHGSKLTGIQDINQPALGSGWTPFDIINGVNADGNEQLTRPFNTKYPYLGYINFYSNLYRSTTTDSKPPSLAAIITVWILSRVTPTPTR